MSITLHPLDLTSKGNTYHKDECGRNPYIQVKNAPASMHTNGHFRVFVSYGLKTTNPAVDNVDDSPTLYDTTDKRYANDNVDRTPPHMVMVTRVQNPEGNYTISLHKQLPLSRSFKALNLSVKDKDLPRLYFKITHPTTNEELVSEYFTVMSKRQPSELDRLKRGAEEMDEHGGPRVADTNGNKRQKRSEQIKKLASDNHTLFAHNKSLKTKADRLTEENRQMMDHIKMLRQMSEAADGTICPATIRMFKIATETDRFHWMKEITKPAGPIMPAQSSTRF